MLARLMDRAAWKQSRRMRSRRPPVLSASEFFALPSVLEISLSQGAEWKALISKYIGTIPVSSDPSPAAEQIMSGIVPPWQAVSSAMIAKVGAAAKDSKWPAVAFVRFRRLAVCASMKSVMSEIITVHLHSLLQY
jgi:hypothetical protein